MTALEISLASDIQTEGFEMIAILGIGIAIIYVLYRGIANLGSTAAGAVTAAAKLTATAFNNVAGTNIGGLGPKVVGTQSYVGSGQPLTPSQAQGIANFLGNPGGGYQLSPDSTQIWFFDGSYYDNTTGHLYDKNGNDQGNLNNSIGSSGTACPFQSVLLGL